jgi:hypothetical protein
MVAQTNPAVLDVAKGVAPLNTHDAGDIARERSHRDVAHLLELGVVAIATWLGRFAAGQADYASVASAAASVAFSAASHNIVN